MMNFSHLIISIIPITFSRICKVCCMKGKRIKLTYLCTSISTILHIKRRTTLDSRYFIIQVTKSVWVEKKGLKKFYLSDFLTKSRKISISFASSWGKIWANSSSKLLETFRFMEILNSWALLPSLIFLTRSCWWMELIEFHEA